MSADFQRPWEAAIELVTLTNQSDSERVAAILSGLDEGELRAVLLDMAMFAGLVIDCATEDSGALLRRAAAAYTAELVRHESAAT